MANKNNIPLSVRLRSGKKIFCEKCKKGYFITDAKDIATSHGFYCNRCGAMVNIDSPIDIE